MVWANGRVSEEIKISSFKDSNIKNCKFLFSLLSSIEPRAIDQTIICEGNWVNKRRWKFRSRIKC